ncbi:MAG: hypothetical protein LBN10_10800 [Propionibacteriaceae bacterium]|jgi:nitroreductase|nr:hypothetical protein [Propionibacteriaceae bacterium]
MDLLEAMAVRHSVRRYTEQAIDADVRLALEDEVARCNADSGLHLQLAFDEPRAFSGKLAEYGHFVNANNYLSVVMPSQAGFEEIAGYYGEQIVLKATTLGLNTCWVGLNYSKAKCACTIGPGEKLRCVISLGYGATQGRPHKSKPLESLCKVDGEMPDWFRAGMEAALLAPTAINQQKFMFTLSGNQVQATTGLGPFAHVDLGIAKYHFALGAGLDNFTWA